MTHPTPLPTRPGNQTGQPDPPDRNPPDRNPPDRDPADQGRALIEVIFLAVLILIPTAYILISILRIQAATFAVAQGARDAARVIDFAPTTAVGVARAQQIARLALTDQNMPADQMQLRFVPVGADCLSSPEITPTLQAGAVYDICVITVVSLPAVPTVLTGSRNTISAAFTLHVGDFRESQ